MEQIQNENALLEKILRDIRESDKSKVVFQAGHFPLFYLEHKDTAVEGLKYWGPFSEYSLELASKLGKEVKNIDKEVEFILIADDRTYREMSTLNKKQLSKRRDNLYKLRSGKDAVLQENYFNILNRNGFAEKDILRHNHDREGREDCLYFSELILEEEGNGINTACASAYTSLFNSPIYFDKDNSYLVSFVPHKCTRGICDIALDTRIKELDASHIFMDTMAQGFSKEKLFQSCRGVTYRKD